MLPTEVRWRSRDGLTLFARDHSPGTVPGPADAASRLPVVCIPGLTRNSLDFDQVASHVFGEQIIYLGEPINSIN